MNQTEILTKLTQLGVIYQTSDGYRINSLYDAEISFGFHHIGIKQKRNLCKSRLDANISSEIIKGVMRPIPMIASNMSTVCNAKFCELLFKEGALGVLHRAAPEAEILREVAYLANRNEWIAASIGVGDEQFDFAKKLIEKGCNIIFIDIAHGYCDPVFTIAQKIKNFSPATKLVLGNTTNVDFLREAAGLADAIKIGLATGYACETKNTAGCIEHQFSTILKFKELSKELNIPVISDGGMREPADLTKAIAAGASAVMAGSIFARCPESAAPTVNQDGKVKKLYAGMASRWVQDTWRGGLKDGTCPEGGVRYLDLGEPLPQLLERWAGALRSGITYGGGVDIRSFQNNVEFIRLM